MGMSQPVPWATPNPEHDELKAKHPPRSVHGLDWYHRERLCYGTTDRPAFLFWGAPPAPEDVSPSSNILLCWADGRCALCGFIEPLVEDHDHRTGLTRGYICRSCNASEGKSDHPGLTAWREGTNPARLLNLDRVYVSPVTGQTPRRPRHVDTDLDQIAGFMV